MYSGNLKEYFDNDNLDEKIEKYTKEKYPEYDGEVLQEQIEIEKSQYLKKEQCTITRIYLNIKYHYEVCSKIFESKKNESKSNSLFSKIKKAIKKYRLKKKLRLHNREYQEENDILRHVNDGEPVYIDLDSFEKNTEFYRIFKGPMKEFVKEKSGSIKKAIKKYDELPDEIEVGKNITIITNTENTNNSQKMSEKNENEIVIDAKGNIVSSPDDEENENNIIPRTEQIRLLNELREDLTKEKDSEEKNVTPKKIA